MKISSSARYKYRSFDLTYVFKVKGETELSLKILDITKKNLFRHTVSIKALGLTDVKQLLTKSSFNTILEKFIEKHALAKKYLIPTIGNVLNQLIEQCKKKIYVQKIESEKFICPLTLEIFQTPVIDDHGHTFEKQAIEEWLKKKNSCPVSNEPIQHLIPNRIFQEAIEKWQGCDPILNFSQFQKDNPKLSSLYLNLAEMYIEEKKYDEATLSYLYLTKYQLQSGKVQEAIETLQACQRGKSASFQINLLLIDLYSQCNQSENALALAIQTADIFSKQNAKSAIILYRRILHDYPAAFALYSRLAALIESPKEKIEILFKGAILAQKIDDVAAERLIQEATTYSENSLICVPVALENIASLYL